MKHTEASMIRLLHARYNTRGGNGPRYAGMAHVRSDAGFDAKRTADYIAVDLWPSKGLALHGHEVKISRADWLNELKDPSKSAEFMKHVDYWWLVIADAAMVKVGELPEGWGMIAVGGDGKLRTVKQAPRLNKPEGEKVRNGWGGLREQSNPVHRGLVVAMVRSAAKTAGIATREEILNAHEEWIATHKPGATLYEVWAQAILNGEGPRKWKVQTFGNPEQATAMVQELTDARRETVGHGRGRTYYAERVEYFSYSRTEWI